MQAKIMILGVPKFLVKISPDYTFQCYFMGSPCTITSLSGNSIRKCNKWSILDEIIRYLSHKESCHKIDIIMEQHSITGKSNGNKYLYSTDTITRAFEYYATSRTLYKRLCDDFQLPNIVLLQRLTSKCSKKDDEQYITSILNELKSYQKRCIVLLDEVYVKPSLTYGGGKVFGFATDDKDAVAKTLLCVMIKCLYGGPQFIII